jgi:hypothetical protein
MNLFKPPERDVCMYMIQLAIKDTALYVYYYQWRNSYELYPVRAGGTQAIGLPGVHPELSCPEAFFI